MSAFVSKVTGTVIGAVGIVAVGCLLASVGLIAILRVCLPPVVDHRLVYAIEDGEVAQAKEFIQQGEGIRPCSAYRGAKCVPLHLAVRKRQIEIVEALLAAGADPNCYDSGEQSTPIMEALSALDPDDPA
jgi:hypothetical protein